MSSIIKSPIEKYKLYLTSELSKLLNIPDIQRVSAHDRLEELYSSFKSTYLRGEQIVIPGVLIAGMCNNVMYLIDGQHRFIASKMLLDNEKSDQQFVVNVIDVNTIEELNSLFERVNHVVPVTCIPTGISRSSVNEVSAYFMNKYKAIFTSSKNGGVKRPHINTTKFEEKIAELLQLYPNSNEVISKLEILNNELKKRNIESFCKTIGSKKENPASVELFRTKATEKGGLYFGMYPNLECFKDLYKTQYLSVKRTSPVAALKGAVWKRYNGDNPAGKCPFCDKDITIATCHYAHDIAHSKGGEMSVDNLYTCCSTCNLSMSTRTYEEAVEYLKSKRLR